MSLRKIGLFFSAPLQLKSVVTSFLSLSLSLIGQIILCSKIGKVLDHRSNPSNGDFRPTLDHGAGAVVIYKF